MRIASAAKSNSEILAALGCADSLIAATVYDKPLLGGNFEVIGSYTDIDIKKLVALKPDIVFTSTFLQEKYAQELGREGIEVVHFDPKSVDDIMQNIRHAGEALGKEEEAMEIIAWMQNEIGQAREKIARRPAVRIYCEEWPSPPMAAGNWVVQMIEIAGGIGILRQGERSRMVSLEEVAGFDPDKIVLNWCGVGLKAKQEILTARKDWERLRAVSSGQIFVVDDSFFNTPSQNVVKGIKQLAAILH